MILLIGHDGQVAWELQRTLVCLGEVVALGRSSQPGLDLSQASEIRNVVRALKPNLIVNAAAYTAVDKAEQESDMAYSINGEAVGILAEEAKHAGACLIHYSTDYVFPGDAHQPYREDDPLGPLGVYGKSKLAGEDAIRATGVDHLILRTAWVYGRRGQNFLLTMLRLMKERESLGIVNDQSGAPTWSRLIAEATALIIARSLNNGRPDLKDQTGTYHLTCTGETTWFGFASLIRQLAIAGGLLDETAAQLNPILTSAYPTPASRPAYSVLDNRKLAEQFNIMLPDWRTGLELCLTETTLP